MAFCTQILGPSLDVRIAKVRVILTSLSFCNAYGIIAGSCGHVRRWQAEDVANLYALFASFRDDFIVYGNGSGDHGSRSFDWRKFVFGCGLYGERVRACSVVCAFRQYNIEAVPVVVEVPVSVSASYQFMTYNWTQIIHTVEWGGYLGSDFKARWWSDVS